MGKANKKTNRSEDGRKELESIMELLTCCWDESDEDCGNWSCLFAEFDVFCRTELELPNTCKRGSKKRKKNKKEKRRTWSG